jgi:hypothetical protein
MAARDRSARRSKAPDVSDLKFSWADIPAYIEPPKSDPVPKGFYSAKEIAEQRGGSHSAAKRFANKLVRAGMAETITLMIYREGARCRCRTRYYRFKGKT